MGGRISGFDLLGCTKLTLNPKSVPDSEDEEACTGYRNLLIGIFLAGTLDADLDICSAFFLKCSFESELVSS